MKKSNCHIYALRSQHAKEAEYICLKPTEYSKIEHLPIPIEIIWSVTLTPIGIAIQTLGWIQIQLGELFMTRRWHHVVAMRWDGSMWELVPEWKKRKLPFPPLLFTGQERRVLVRTVKEEEERRRLADRRKAGKVL